MHQCVFSDGMSVLENLVRHKGPHTTASVPSVDYQIYHPCYMLVDRALLFRQHGAPRPFVTSFAEIFDCFFFFN